MEKKIIALFFILFVGFIFIDGFTNINEVYGFIYQKEYLKAIVYFGNYFRCISGSVFVIK